MEVHNLDYKDFRNINISFNSHTFYSVVGASNCGKTTFFKLLSSLIPTNNVICCNNVFLNDHSCHDYIVNIGVVERLNSHSFIYKKVINEMQYPLKNLGYNESKIQDIIRKSLSFFGVSYFLDKSICELKTAEKQLLLIIVSLLHSPKVLLLDSVLDYFSKKERNNIIVLLKKLCSRGLTVISFTKELDALSDKIILMDKYSIIGEYDASKIYEDDKLFYSHNLEIPFIIDLSIKLKMYGLLDKEYSNMKEMVDDLWP